MLDPHTASSRRKAIAGSFELASTEETSAISLTTV